MTHRHIHFDVWTFRRLDISTFGHFDFVVRYVERQFQQEIICSSQRNFDDWRRQKYRSSYEISGEHFHNFDFGDTPHRMEISRSRCFELTGGKL